MNILLINPYVPLEVVYGRHGEQIGAILPPLGILYLKAYLQKAQQHQIDILDANALKMDAAAVQAYCATRSFDVIGFTATTLAYPYAVDAARLLRTSFPAITLIIGGAHAQGDQAGILTEHPAIFDYACYSEGEFALELLLDYLENRIQEQQLLGWVYLKQGVPITTPAPQVPEDLDIFGHPAEIIPREWIHLYHEKVLSYRQLPMFAVMSSRGCPFQCTFCSTPSKYKTLYQGKMRYHSLDWLLEELRILEQRYGVKEVNIVDDTFNVDRSRALEFSRRKIASGLQMSWACNFEANIADPELIQAMKNAGCWTIMIGGESGSNRMLEFMHKGVTAERLLQVCRWADEIGIVTRVSFILGLPTETLESINETIRLLQDSDIHFPYFQLYVPLPGSAMYDQLGKYGKIIVKDPRQRSASKVNFLPDGLSEQELQHAYRTIFKRVYFRWRMVRNHLRFIHSRDDLIRYWKGFSALLQFS